MKITTAAYAAFFADDDANRITRAGQALSAGLYLSIHSNGLNDITDRLSIQGMCGLDPRRDRDWDLSGDKRVVWDQPIALDA